MNAAEQKLPEPAAVTEKKQKLSEPAALPEKKQTAARMDIRTVVQLAFFCALMFVGKEAMNSLPNIHPVMLLILLCVRCYGFAAIYPVIGFVAIELALYGLGIWSVTYLYVWPLAVFLALPFRNRDSRVFWASFAGIYGLLFGMLTAAATILLSGPKAAVAYWVAGIPFDIVHCISNFILVYFLLPPLYALIQKLRQAS